MYMLQPYKKSLKYFNILAHLEAFLSMDLEQKCLLIMI